MRPISFFDFFFYIQHTLFKEKEILKRSLIHDQYGGNRQSGISASAKFPFIFIFTGAEGKQYGYKDRWENNNVFSYTGEGQLGDMQFTKGNLALREHLRTGKRVFLFRYIQRSFVEFVSEVESIDFDYFLTHDREGDLRTGIKFFFKKVGVLNYIIPEELFALKEPEGSIDSIQPNFTEREGLVTTRVGQGAYRKSILHRWEYKCAATNFNDISILIASHIVPWKDSTDKERLDVDNGILLSPDYDALFDRHLISFDNMGKIILSKQMELSDLNQLGVTGKEKIKNLSEGNKNYLIKHQEHLTF